MSDLDIVRAKIMSKNEFRMKRLEQRIYGIYHGLRIPTNHFLYPSFNQKIDQLVTGGIIDEWYSKQKNHRYVVQKPPKTAPFVLNMNHLSIGFQIWLSLLLVAFLVFLGELSIYWVRKGWRMFLRS